MSLEELTETTLEGKLRQLAALFSEKCFDEIDMGFCLNNDINCDREYFVEMMTGAIQMHFQKAVDCEQVAACQTLGCLANLVENAPPMNCDDEC